MALMSAEHTFPTLRLAVLHNLRDLQAAIVADPDALRGPSCPYDNETIELLEGLLRPRIVEKVITREAPVAKPGRGAPKKEIVLNEDDLEEVESSARELLQDLKDLGKGGADDVPLDTSAKVQIVRAKAALIETVIKQTERVYNVKRISGFEATVISILEDLVGEDHRDEFLRRLEPYKTR